jgi:hypothetical protein
MAQQVPGFTNGICKAAADLSAHQFKFMKVTSAGFTVDLNTTNAANCLGVLQDKPAAAGLPAAVMVDGITKVKLGATVAAGVDVMSNTAGLAITATGAAAVVMGTLLEGGVANDIVTMQLLRATK